MNDQIRQSAREAMKTKGLTQEQMASQLGIPRTQVNRMLNGDIGKIPESWAALANALDMEIALRPKSSQ